MKKTTKRFLALLLCALLLIPLPMVQGETSLSTDKIDADLLEMMEQGDILLPVRIDCQVTPQMRQDFDAADFEQYVEELKRDLSLEDATPVLSNEYYFHCWKENYNGQKHEKGSEFPVLAVWLSEEEILRIAQHERVTMLYGHLYQVYGDLHEEHYWDGFGPIVCSPNGYGPYGPESALLVLQWAVGLRADISLLELIVNYGYDVDKNQKINAIDALYHLQEHVGLVTFGQIKYVKSWQLMEIATEGYEFEEARLPKGEFLFAPDLNEDGKADIIDLYLKYQDRLCAPVV